MRQLAILGLGTRDLTRNCEARARLEARVRLDWMGLNRRTFLSDVTQGCHAHTLLSTLADAHTYQSLLTDHVPKGEGSYKILMRVASRAIHATLVDR